MPADDLVTLGVIIFNNIPMTLSLDIVTWSSNDDKSAEMNFHFNSFFHTVMIVMIQIINNN